MNGWDIELIVTRDAREQRAASRDRERGLLRKVRNGISVLAASVTDLRNEDRHLVAMRALATAAKRPVTFSHWSGAAGQGLDVIGQHLIKPHDQETGTSKASSAMCSPCATTRWRRSEGCSSWRRAAQSSTSLRPGRSWRGS